MSYRLRDKIEWGHCKQTSGEGILPANSNKQDKSLSMRSSVRRAPEMCILLCAPALASAAEPVALESGMPPLLSITITPEWRPVDAQRTAKTVNAYSGEELDSTGIDDSFDLQYRAPGLVFKTNAVLGQPYLRGVGSDMISAGAEASVASFVDGVYLPRGYDSILNFYDLERVEVIKGPQGVHLGRNVVGGAISVHTRDPEPYRSAYADVQVGAYSARQLRGAVNVPIEGTKTALRLAGVASRRDGYVDNTFLGSDEDDEDYSALRGKLLYAPRSDFSLLLAAEHHSKDDSRGLTPQPDASVPGSGAIALDGSVSNEPRRTTANRDVGAQFDSDRYSAKLTWRGTAHELTSTTSFARSDGDFLLDLDNTDLDYSSNQSLIESDTFTQEFRLSSQPDDDAWDYVAGLYLLDEDAAQRLDVRLPLFGVQRVPDGSVATRSYAAFGQLAYRVASAWRAKAGIRYSRDRRELALIDTLTDPMGVLGAPGTVVATQNNSESWGAVTPELGLEYAPSADRLYYATVARGYKAGGFNTNSVQPAFDPEFLLAYEAGFKTTLRDRRLRLNGAVFHYDYDDMQLDTPPAGAPVGTAPLVINAAKSTICGADLEWLLQPTARWLLSLQATTLFTARFDEFESVDLNNPTVDPNRSGNTLPQAPELSFNARAEHAWPSRYGTITLGGEYRYQSDIYFNIYQDPATHEDGYGLINANLDFTDKSGNWYAQMFARNLANTLYAENRYRADPLAGTLRMWGAPRTVGVRIGRRW